MLSIIQAIVAQIPSGHYFDAHYVIAVIIAHYHDDYLVFACKSGVGTGANTAAVHGQISKLIADNAAELLIADNAAELAVERVDAKSWSLNISGKGSSCAIFFKP